MVDPLKYVTIAQLSEMLGQSRYDTKVVEAMIRAGHIKVVRFEESRQRYVSVEDADRAVRMRAGLHDAETLTDRVAQMQAELDQLREQARALREERDAIEQAEARDALSVLSLEECIEILGRIQNEHGIHDRSFRLAYEAQKRVQAQLDARAAPVSLGKRPRGVPKYAKSKPIPTGVGLVDIWMWERPNGSWSGAVGGPRATSPRSGIGKRETLKQVRQEAVALYGKATRKSSARLRFLILERDDFTCRYCGRRAPDVELHVDHAIAIIDGGSDHEDNLVTACQDCNLGKAGRSVPVTTPFADALSRSNSLDEVER